MTPKNHGIHAYIVIVTRFLQTRPCNKKFQDGQDSRDFNWRLYSLIDRGDGKQVKVGGTYRSKEWGVSRFRTDWTQDFTSKTLVAKVIWYLAFKVAFIATQFFWTGQICRLRRDVCIDRNGGSHCILLVYTKLILQRFRAGVWQLSHCLCPCKV